MKSLISQIIYLIVSSYLSLQMQQASLVIYTGNLL